MEEAEVKSELLENGETLDNQDCTQNEEEGVTDITFIKKRKMEIEIDLSLIKAEPRQRRAVARYV